MQKLSDALKAALVSECGIVVESSDVSSLLIRFRQEISKNKSLYGSLTAIASRDAPDTEVWIVHNGFKDRPPA
jgi:hypothetical protein